MQSGWKHTHKTVNGTEKKHRLVSLKNKARPETQIWDTVPDWPRLHCAVCQMEMLIISPELPSLLLRRQETQQ